MPTSKETTRWRTTGSYVPTLASKTSLIEETTTSVVANERIQEREAFVEKLRLIEELGFACSELDTFMTVEPLDRWSGDGYLAPANRDELLRNEQTWHVDINDGVRVNIAPLQLAGVLTSDVLKPTDAKKALAAGYAMANSHAVAGWTSRFLKVHAGLSVSLSAEQSRSSLNRNAGFFRADERKGLRYDDAPTTYFQGPG